jgi:hypothetical protein
MKRFSGTIQTNYTKASVNETLIVSPSSSLGSVEMQCSSASDASEVAFVFKFEEVRRFLFSRKNKIWFCFVPKTRF